MPTFTMPSLGADMEAGTVLEWRVKSGDAVHRGDIMAVVDTEKSEIEVETFNDGVVEDIVVEPGQKVAVGAVLATLTEPDDVPAEGTAHPATPATPPRNVPTAAHPPAPAIDGVPSASPVVRHLAAERGLDLAIVHGTGAGGAITRSDIEHLAPTPSAKGTRITRRRVSPLARRLAATAGLDVDTITGTGLHGTVRADDVRRAQADATTARPPTARPPKARPAPPATAQQRSAEAIPAVDHRDSMRRAIARLMTKANEQIPHYYLTTTFDMTAAMCWLHQQNEGLSVNSRLIPAALLLKATALAAKDTPGINGEWCDEHFRRASSVNLGVVTSIRGGGLMVPVIPDAETLPLPDLMASLRAAVERVRFGRLLASDLTGATITVTNLGEQGVESVYGVVFPPQVALVGFGAVVDRPWAVDGLLGVRPVITATLAADHRASDGAVGARFLARVGRLMQKPGEL
jgi:pyruvate dehydrogenase E2 component (dihydrolipoamide acetyltransferase)